MELLTEPHVRLWTRRDYYAMAEVGLFNGVHVELIEGQVIEMSPMGSLHATAVALAATMLEMVFRQGFFVRWQMPLDIGERSEPEPDVAVIAGEVRDYKEAHPTTAVLIVEVADSSLEYDRTTKASLYAKAGISDYWVLNLTDRQLEVRRTPVADSSQPFGFGYKDLSLLTATDTVTPIAKPQSIVAVADLLP